MAGEVSQEKFLDKPEYEGFSPYEAWVVCDGCSRNIPCEHPEFVLWTEVVFWDRSNNKFEANYLCPDCDYSGVDLGPKSML